MPRPVTAPEVVHVPAVAVAAAAADQAQVLHRAGGGVVPPGAITAGGLGIAGHLQITSDAVADGRDERITPGERPQVDGVLCGQGLGRPEKGVHQAVIGIEMSGDISVVVDGRCLLRNWREQIGHMEILHTSDRFARTGGCIAIGSSLAEQLPTAQWMSHPHDLPGSVDVAGRDAA